MREGVYGEARLELEAPLGNIVLPVPLFDTPERTRFRSVVFLTPFQFPQTSPLPYFSPFAILIHNV